MAVAVEERRWFDPFGRLRHGAVELTCHTLLIGVPYILIAYFRGGRGGR
jgi:hypothetical protein